MENELYHHGVLGQKWGVRRYQNKDGSLTKAGQRKYSGKKVRLKNMNDSLRKQYAENRVKTAGSIDAAITGHALTAIKYDKRAVNGARNVAAISNVKS